VYTHGTNTDGDTGVESPRLNLLLTYGGWRERPAVQQLPQLLRPMGINALEAASGEEAESLIREREVHIAVVDLELPHRADANARTRPISRTEEGLRVLQLLRRLDPTPPTIVVRPPQSSTREYVRGLSQSLRDGAFAVLDRPLQLESMLEVLRRILKRHYQDAWPSMF
jgi:DNA-binding response OmpR family regulator